MLRALWLGVGLLTPEAVIEEGPAGGLALLSVVAPAGIGCEARALGQAEGTPLRFESPGTLTLEPGLRYAVRCALPAGPPWVAELEARPDLHRVVRLVAADPAPAPDDAPAPIPVLSEEALEALQRRLAQAPLAAERRAALEALPPEARLSVAQVDRLLGALIHGSDRRAALELLLPRLVNPKDGGRLAGRFEFSADRAWLKARLAALAPAGKR